MRGLAPPLPPLSLLLPGVLLGSLMSSFLGKAVLLRVARTLTPSTDERHNIGSSNGLGLCKGTVNVGLLSPEGSFQLVHGDGVKEEMAETKVECSGPSILMAAMHSMSSTRLSMV